MTELLIASRILSTAALLSGFIGSVSAQNEPAEPSLHLWRQAAEQVIILNADPEPFQERVGDDFDVIITEGQARLIIVLQDSKINFLNGENVGPSQDVHIWVSIEGPRSGVEIPVIGAQSTLRTMSWFKLFGGSSHPQIRTALANAGLLYEPIKDFSLIHSGPEIRGNVVIGPEISFSWNATAKAPSVELIGVNHDLYTRNPDGKLVATYVQALLKAVAWGSEGTLEVQGDVVPGGLFPTGSHPVEVNSYDPIWIRASLNVSVPE